MRIRQYKHIILLLILPALVSCAHFRSASDECCTLSFAADTAGRLPQRVAVLPFRNQTGEPALGALVRQSFYDHFSSKNFHDVELSEVDLGIRELEAALDSSWETLPPAELGKFFNADYLVFGDVRDISRHFWLLYSQLAISFRVRMVAAATGETVWHKEVVQRSHSGDLPLGILDIFTIIMRARNNINSESTQSLIDKTCREMVARIPDPPPGVFARQLVDIQLCALLDQGRAQEINRELIARGFTPRINPARVRNKTFYRVLIGPFADEQARQIVGLINGDSRFAPVVILRDDPAT